MARPKSGGEIRALELADTRYWAGLIRAQSGLSDAQIESLLGYADPNGRNFNRWRTGKRAMSHDAIQLLVQKARKIGLLSTPRSLRRHRGSAAESRASANSKVREIGRAHV